jgi:CHAT domain-containing protein/tetratricopeptide (TPR) repeat protein
MQSSEMMYLPVELWHLLANCLVAKFEQGGGTNLNYIDEAILLDRDALQLCPPSHPMRSVSLIRFAIHLGRRYDQLGAARDLDEIIVLDREALNHHPQEYPGWISLNNLAARLCSRYSQLWAIEDLDEAIALERAALHLCRQGHPDRSTPLNSLTDFLSARYKQLGEMEDLDEAIFLAQGALDLSTQGHPDRSTSLNSLAVLLFIRYKRLGAMEDLSESTDLAREALDLRPQGHPDRSMSLDNLVNCLSDWYKQLGGMEVLDEATDLAREALDLRPQGHPNRPMSLHNLAGCLFTRYEQLGVMEGLDGAIVLAREALDLRPQGHPDWSAPLNNLAAYLSTRYEQLGAMEDLDGAIVLAREALNHCPQKDPTRSVLLSTLSNCLSSRYSQLGALQDLDEAIIHGRGALDLCTQEHPDRSMSLSNLAIRLSFRYIQFRVMEDLEEAIVLDREALDLRPQGHPCRSTSLNNLAIRLSVRYKDSELGTMQDLNEAIFLVREALHLRPQGHPDRSSSLNDLAVHLSSRFNHLGAIEDLNEAIVLDREALDLRPHGHPDRSQSLENLAFHLYIRFTRPEQLQDKEELFSLYAQLVNVPQIVFPADLSAARAWICMAEHFHHPTILLAYETSLRLVVQHLANLPSLPQHLGILENLTSSLGVDAFSACLRKCAPACSVELLEQGRGVFWSQLTRLHSPLDEAIVSSPAGKALTDEFTRLASLIRNVLHSPGPDQHERVCHLNLELQMVVTDIRKLPGLSRFLLPSLFSDLRRAASLGPVIIVNASNYGCDALIVFLDQDPVHIPLQITRENVRELSTELHTLTSRAKRADVTKELAFFLRKLWDQIVSPIVDCLQTTLPSQSRIWWCPTGEFSVLPLHAAGPYRKGQQNLPHIYISSYTPTLNALIRARRGDPSNSAPDQKRFIAIGQASATGETELVSVGAELDIIGQRVNSLARFTRIDGEESCISSVVEELGKHEWVHLACHGLPDRKQPFESAFALHDGHFTIQRIIGCDLKNPEFAYLSACHTTVGDEKSPDEVIHLASAMQFVGFRSVIGTMWAVDDGATIKIASTFYNHMVDESGRLDHTRAAFALNETMKSVRNIPFDQRILYIHLGA